MDWLPNGHGGWRSDNGAFSVTETFKKFWRIHALEDGVFRELPNRFISANEAKQWVDRQVANMEEVA